MTSINSNKKHTSVLIAPSTNYPTIQSAIDASKSGDTIKILPGFYSEQLSIINKDNIKIVAVDSKGNPSNGNQVRFTSNADEEIGLTIYANNVTVSGIVFIKYYLSVSLIGNNNTLTYIVSDYCKGGMTLRGNNNKLISCLTEHNTIVGINIGGNYNQIISTAIRVNELGLNVLEGEFIGNIFYKNLIHNNGYVNVRISTLQADKNVFLENTITNSDFGLLVNSGRAAIISNVIQENTKIGISYQGDKGLILENNLVNNAIGQNLQTCNSLIGGNIIQQGENSGIIINGSENEIVTNIISNYGNSGIVINGCNNKICSNNLQKNKTNLIINGLNNCTDCNYNYCSSLGCKNFDDLSQILDIFNMPLNKFIAKYNNTKKY